MSSAVGTFVGIRETSCVNSAQLGDASENRITVSNQEPWRLVAENEKCTQERRGSLLISGLQVRVLPGSPLIRGDLAPSAISLLSAHCGDFCVDSSAFPGKNSRLGKRWEKHSRLALGFDINSGRCKDCCRTHRRSEASRRISEGEAMAVRARRPQVQSRS